MDINLKSNLHNFDAISVAIASPEQIMSWSNGEVKKPETINYRTQKPERDGLFCERIFGPTKNWECYCGKYKRIRYKGVICEKCGVEVTHSKVRRERMGHIKLAVPVTHIWYLRSTPSRIGLLLNLPIKTIEQVVYFAAYIVTDVDQTAKEETKEQLAKEFKAFKKKLQEEYDSEREALKAVKGSAEEEKLERDFAHKIDSLTEQHNQAKSDLDSIKVAGVLSELEYRDMSLKFGHIFHAGTGAEAIQSIIENIDLPAELSRIESEVQTATGQKQKKLIKRMKLVGSLVQSEIQPEWMILSVLPVIPPDLRPMVQLDGGRFAASDLNDLYRRVINRNNRLKKLLSIGAPEVICRNEKRMLQEAVDTLLNISARQSRTAFNAGDKRKLKSLSDMLKGKQGRFRQNLLGKRVDYSGRSVIVVGPKLKLNECGLPKEMALTLFKPFVIGRLIQDGYAHNIKNAEKLITANRKEVWDILEEVTSTRYVLLNRAPTLHRLGIQAFKPKLIEGKAIQVHPLICVAFNADFDGDQMAVHLPLSKQAQKEAEELIQSSKNLLKPTAGEPTVNPTQDMVLGCYYLTKLTVEQKGAGMIFADATEALAATELGYVHIQAPIKARLNGEIIETTVGRIIFNQILPENLQFVNQVADKNVLSDLITNSFNMNGKEVTAELADNLKTMGYKYATMSGVSISAEDMIIPKSKDKIIEAASEKVKQISELHWNGVLTEQERYINTIKIWTATKAEITVEMIKNISDENNLSYMIKSGARGNWGQITQLCGIKGLVANPSGKTIELPIKSNLKEGFTILEYFIATHGGRKGKSDTALKTAEAGYLTRRLVDAVQDVIIKEIDCGTTKGHLITQKEAKEFGTSFETSLFGRITFEDIVHPKTGEVLIGKESEIAKAQLRAISENDIQEVSVRSPLTCMTENGVCQQCYGTDLGHSKLVDLGTAVGIIAAQSIGEPGTQLTMRTFHMGGVAQESDITQGLTRVEELFEARTPKSPAILAGIHGEIKVNNTGKTIDIILTSTEPVKTKYDVPENYGPTVKVGDRVKLKQAIAKAENSNRTVKTKENGIIFSIAPGVITIESEGVVQKEYSVPKGKSIKVKDGDFVEAGAAMTSGSINLRELMKLGSNYAALRYIITEVQGIYSSQGQTISDKHIEIIARQMLSKVRILESGKSEFISGQVVDRITIDNVNDKLKAENKKEAYYENLLLGLTRISLVTDSWLSAASFQETIRVLVEAATTKQVDHLKGLKENVIIGKLIPAGAIYKKAYEVNNSIPE
jgi:DNA-directed RNA polymerase subunit beta'